MTERNLGIVNALGASSRERGHSLLELAVSRLAEQNTVASVICGATQAGQVEQNVKAVVWMLSADDLAEIDKLTKPG